MKKEMKEEKLVWLVYNASLNKEIYEKNHQIYEEACRKFGMRLVFVPNTSIISMIEYDTYALRYPYKKPEFVLFLDKDIRLAKQLEYMGFLVYNSAETIAVCDDKILMTQVLAKHKIPMPKTIFSPFFFHTYERSHAEQQAYNDFLREELSYPMVIKEAFGSFGEQVYLADNIEQLQKIQQQIGIKPHIYQAYIRESFGRDVRLYVVGEKVVASVLRQNQIDFRANITNGGTITPYKPPKAFEEMAVKSSEAVGAVFCGVDILIGEGETPILCEVNSNAYIKGIFEEQEINVAEYIVEYILKEILKKGV